MSGGITPYRVKGELQVFQSQKLKFGKLTVGVSFLPDSDVTGRFYAGFNGSGIFVDLNREQLKDLSRMILKSADELPSELDSALKDCE